MTERQGNLLRKAHRALRVSKDLMKLGYLEDAAARAYYSMFYVAEAFLDGEGLHFTKHSAVIAEFGRLFVKTGRVPSEYHVFLKEAQHDRLGADYADLSTLTQEETQEHLEHAESFLRLAGNLIGSAEAPLRGLTDPDVLKAAADSNRIPVTHDRRTTPGHFAAFIANQTSPGCDRDSQGRTDSESW